MMNARRVGQCFVLGLVLMSSGGAQVQAQTQVAASADLVGRWRSPAFTEHTSFGYAMDGMGAVTDTFAAQTTIVLQRDSTWLSYTTFRMRNAERSHRSTLLNSGGAWRRAGDTLWLAADAKWADAAIAYTADAEAVIRDTLKMRPQPAPTVWHPYRATLRDQQLSLGQFGATATASEPFVCGTGPVRPVLNYERLLCPGVYDRRPAATP